MTPKRKAALATAALVVMIGGTTVMAVMSQDTVWVAFAVSCWFGFAAAMVTR